MWHEACRILGSEGARCILNRRWRADIGSASHSALAFSANRRLDHLKGNVASERTQELAQTVTPETDACKRLENCRDLQAKRLSPGYAVVKRLMDFFGALLLILLLSPVFLVVMLLVKAHDRGPIFYRSTRIGLCGKPFGFWKFRTMVVNADRLLNDLQQQNEKDGPIFKMKNDPRVTPIGRTLRRLSLDELPQLFSVLMGEMSLVGPRPPLPHEVLQYRDQDLERLRVKPGITCYWQVMGRSNLSFEEWMELDRRYIREMSVWLDIELLLKTPSAVLKSSGSY